MNESLRDARIREVSSIIRKHKTKVREKWAMVYSDEHYWLVGFDGGGRPIWSMNRLRAGFFAPSEIDIPNVQFIAEGGK